MDKSLNLTKKVKTYSAFEKKNFLFVYCLIAFPVIQFAIFWGFVNFSMVSLAFKDANGLFSFQAFKDVFAAVNGADKWGFNLLDMAWRSIQIFLLQNVLIFAVNILFAYILTKKVIGHRFFRTCYMLPGIVGTVVFSSIMKNIYAYDGGIVAIGKLLGFEIPSKILHNGFLGAAPYAFNTMKWQLILFGMTGANIIIAGAYMRIPTEIFEAAKLDGVSFWREIFNIAIPCIWSTISTLAIFNLCALFTSDFGAFLYSNGTGNPNMSTIGFYLYFLQVRIAEHSQKDYYSYASAFGIIVTALTIPVVLVGQYFLSRRETVEY